MGWLIYIGIAALAAALCAFIADRKGRDWLSWAILGAALGIIALVWLLVLPRGAGVYGQA